MASETCAKRLRTALSVRGLRQSELCRKTGIPKSALSQYLSGAFEPKQDRIALLAHALDVSEAWLMGFDVPMERDIPTPENLTSEESALLAEFRSLSDEKQSLLLKLLETMQ